MNLILAIDDEKSTLKLLEVQLMKAGYQVITAPSGKEGLDLARTGNPDLILLDILMPGMDGYEVMRNLKKEETTKSIPIIILTSKSKKEDVVSAMRYGIQDYIIKPHNLPGLVQKIDAALRVGKLQKMEDAAERTEHINISRGQGTTVISFRTDIKAKQVLAEARTVFNVVFFKLVRNDHIAFDVRSLDKMDEADIRVLGAITGLFTDREVHIVAGRHYGTIVSAADFEERVKLHISFGDLEMYLSSKNKSKH